MCTGSHRSFSLWVSALVSCDNLFLQLPVCLFNLGDNGLPCDLISLEDRSLWGDGEAGFLYIAIFSCNQLLLCLDESIVILPCNKKNHDLNTYTFIAVSQKFCIFVAFVTYKIIFLWDALTKYLPILYLQRK